MGNANITIHADQRLAILKHFVKKIKKMYYKAVSMVVYTPLSENAMESSCITEITNR